MSPGTRRTFVLAATLALAGSALAGPAMAQDEANIDDLMFGSNYAPEKGTPGGSVVIADWQIPDQLNPYYVSAFVNTQVFAATNDQLWDVSADFKYIPELAVSIPTISNGGVRIDAEPTEVCENRREGYEDIPGFEMDINIRPGLKWSDGETLDLNDYKYTMVDWMMDPDNVGLYAGTDGYNLIDRFEVSEDGLSATVHFCTGFTGFYGLFAAPPLPEHYMSTIPVADAAQLSYPVGPGLENAPVSGPFKYASASPSAIELVRNDNWVSPWTGDPAYLDRVVYRFFDGAKDSMIAAFLAGEIDLATDLLQGDYAAIAGVDPSIGVAAHQARLGVRALRLQPGRQRPGRGSPGADRPERAHGARPRHQQDRALRDGLPRHPDAGGRALQPRAARALLPHHRGSHLHRVRPREGGRDARRVRLGRHLTATASATRMASSSACCTATPAPASASPPATTWPASSAISAWSSSTRPRRRRSSPAGTRHRRTPSAA